MKKEISNSAGRFTEAELKTKVRESKAFWASPEGRAAAAKQEREKRSRKTSGVKSPSLAARGTKPALVSPLAARARFIGKF